MWANAFMTGLAKYSTGRLLYFKSKPESKEKDWQVGLESFFLPSFADILFRTSLTLHGQHEESLLAQSRFHTK